MTRILLLTVTVVVSLASNSTAQPFSTTPPIDRQLTVSQIYNYRVSEYSPRVRVEPVVSRALASFDTPEAATISHISSMLAGDWEWFMDMWRVQSRVSLERDLVSSGITRDDIVKRWAVLRGATIELVTRIDTGIFTIVVFSTGPNSRLPVVLREETGRWYLTDELKDDPGLSAGPSLNWGPDGKASISKVIR